MSKKMPQSHNTHTYDAEALKHLVKAFGTYENSKHWKIIPPVDMFSHLEYGQDCLVQVTRRVRDGFEMTGAEFSVQNKATNQEIGKRRISARIKVATLNYLLALNRPVMLHFYHIPSSEGYWMWLDDFLREHPEESWQEIDQVTISILQRNVLNVDAVKQIEAYILREHHLESLMHKIRRLSRMNPNYELTFTRGDTQLITTVRPRHERALEVEPLSFNMTLGEEADARLQHAIETGEPANFSAQIKFSGLIAALFPEVDTNNMEVLLLPLTPKVGIWNFECIDEADHVILETGFTRMTLTRAGPHVKVWQGTPPNYPIAIETTFHLQERSLSLHVKFSGDNRDPVSLNNGYKAFDALWSVPKIRVTNEHGQTGVIERSPTPFCMSEEETLWRRLVRGLAFITEKTGVKFVAPTRSTKCEVLSIEEIVKTLQEGVSIQPVNLPEDPNVVLYSTIRLKDAQGMLLAQDQGQSLTIAIPDGDMEATILGQNIALGPIRRVFQNMKLHKVDQIRQMVERGESLDTPIVVYLEIDRKSIVTQFVNWMPEEARNLATGHQIEIGKKAGQDRLVEG